MTPFKLTPAEAEILYTSLMVRKCQIETGTNSLSAADARQQRAPLKTLTPEQVILVQELQKLMQRLQPLFFKSGR